MNNALKKILMIKKKRKYTKCTPVVRQKRLLRNNFFAYVKKIFQFFHPDDEMISSWHIECIAKLIPEYSKIVINLPPRTLKSLICTIAYATWMIGNKPTNKIIIATYGDFLSRSLIEDCKSIIESPWYKELFPKFKLLKKNSQENTK